MVFEGNRKCKYVIVDTSAFIRNANLQEIGDNIITVPEVVGEIKSKRQLRNLVVLPYDLQIKEAFPENVKHVAEFSKKTGDFPSLSAADLKVMALTYQLEKEHVGEENIRSLPEISRTVDYCNYSAITADKIAGFYRPNTGQNLNNFESNENKSCIVNEVIEEKHLNLSVENLNINNDDDDSEYLSACSDLSNVDEFVEVDRASDNSDEYSEIIKEDGSCAFNLENKECSSHGDNINEIVNDMFVKIQNDKASSDYSKGDNKYIDHKNNSDEELDDEDVADYDDVGWITPSNIKHIKQEMYADNLEDKPVTVACFTMDFAMQNVLRQMGLNIVSIDGRVIKQVRTFILRCYACFKTTSVMTKVFCHHCGNKTLKKVAVSIDADGNEKIHINLRRPLTARGKKKLLTKSINTITSMHCQVI